MFRHPKALLPIALILAALGSFPALAQLALAPEKDSGWQTKESVRADKHMVVAANPLAAQAGLDILRKGGSAIDAAIATQMLLNVVEPQSSGIGGGLFLLHWDAAKKALTTYDGRETAPAAAKPDRFLNADGAPLDFKTAVKSGRSVGVPGTLRALELAHREHGKLPWAALFEPAIALADEGFAVSTRLALMLRAETPENFGAEARAYFYDAEGKPRDVGFMLKNPAFADTLRTIARDGADAFYHGSIAADIVARVNAAPLSLGDMTADDVKLYASKARAPVCVVYRGDRVCGMGPPSSGGLTVAMVLELIEPTDLGREAMAADKLHLIAEAEKLAYADRNRYMADSDFVDMPSGLLDEGYLAERRALISARSMGTAQPGNPPGTASRGRDATREKGGTSHVSIVDGEGNAVSMTTTIEGAFGSGLMVRGFLLNNELTDFSFKPTDETSQPVANRVEGGKRPRSSMAPTIVLDDAQRLRLITGSPGGSQIILYVVKTLVANLDWGLDAQKAAALPNFGSRNGPFELEEGMRLAPLEASLTAMGQEVKRIPMTSGLSIIAVQDDQLVGGADPRREGVAVGD